MIQNPMGMGVPPWATYIGSFFRLIEEAWKEAKEEAERRAADSPRELGAFVFALFCVMLPICGLGSYAAYFAVTWKRGRWWTRAWLLLVTAVKAFVQAFMFVVLWPAALTFLAMLFHWSEPVAAFFRWGAQAVNLLHVDWEFIFTQFVTRLY